MQRISLADRLEENKNRVYCLERDVDNYYPQKKETNFPENITYMLDFIYTPGSFLRTCKESLSNPKKRISNLEKYINYTAASLFEGFRIFSYFVFSTISPIIPLSFIGTGIISKFINKNQNLKNKK